MASSTNTLFPLRSLGNKRFHLFLQSSYNTEFNVTTICSQTPSGFLHQLSFYKLSPECRTSLSNRNHTKGTVQWTGQSVTMRGNIHRFIWKETSNLENPFRILNPRLDSLWVSTKILDEYRIHPVPKSITIRSKVSHFHQSTTLPKTRVIVSRNPSE